MGVWNMGSMLVLRTWEVCGSEGGVGDGCI